ncbi:hypothetical protein [Streptomyces chiangmaiensis]|uniref:Uncharacterized protein n=1 Tax=Streptomyces chiangmaiensis TaxID=766497 RepID=A0ABU7FT20_9ACTN|nr:hypothetical protein [Streptomyces chiangmaiensis]MED7826957.1 hypothetical protein [Streptomyces chiangmaiensis]
MGDSVSDETLAAVRACIDPREVVAVTTHGVRVDNERHFALLRVLITAAALEETARETLARTDRSTARPSQTSPGGWRIWGL